MTSPDFKVAAIAAGVALALAGTAAQASHFRGGALIPTVSATGLLTVNSTTFWAPSSPNQLGVVVTGQGGTADVFAPNDTSDSRFTKVTGVHTRQLPGAGTYALAMSSCCRVAGIANFVGGSSTSWQLDSTIFWNGSSAATPILFSFSNVQPEVLRNANYNGNLGALAGAGLTLSYDQALNPVIASQPPGFTINTSTGALHIPLASTTLANYPDNPSGNIGADLSFSGHIFAQNNVTGASAGQVEFEWLFDAVNTAGNNAPAIVDVIINALVGSTVATTLTATDDSQPLPPGLLTFSAIGLLGGQGSCSNAPSFNPATQAFSWNTAGCALGPHIFQVQASDSLLTDFGTITINLNGVTPPPVSLSQAPCRCSVWPPWDWAHSPAVANPSKSNSACIGTPPRGGVFFAPRRHATIRLLLAGSGTTRCSALNQVEMLPARAAAARNSNVAAAQHVPRRFQPTAGA